MGLVDAATATEVIGRNSKRTKRKNTERLDSIVIGNCITADPLTAANICASVDKL